MKVAHYSYMALLFLASFILRFSGVLNSHPFWVDEFSTARNARHFLDYGLSAFTRPDVLVERHNITTHLLAAASFSVFGQTEAAARLPFVLIGSLLPVAVYLLTRRLAGPVAAVCASLLTACSYLMITWSRQARGYVILNVAILLTMYFYLRLLEKRNCRKSLAGLSVSVATGLLTHPLFYLVIIAMGLHWILFNRTIVFGILRNKRSYLIAIPLLVIALAVLYAQDSLRFFTTPLFGGNNVWYYHSFLWREYALVSFLGLLGLVVLFFKHRGGALLIVLYTVLHLIFINFMFGHYLTKYLLPIFPFLFMGMAVLFTDLSELVIKSHLPKVRYKKYLIAAVPVLLVLFILKNGDKFVTRPWPYYSVNKDFREIANIDYDQVYAIVRAKGRMSEGRTAVIETWPDRAKWYIGNNIQAVYFFRWQNEHGSVSGHTKTTEFTIDSDGEKRTADGMRYKFVGELADLKRVMKKYPRGFIYIDDATLPKDVIDYAQKNLKKEIYLDHYPLDENPYSIWPATLYSWGV